MRGLIDALQLAFLRTRTQVAMSARREKVASGASLGLEIFAPREKDFVETVLHKLEEFVQLRFSGSLNWICSTASE
jgi:hypothetical protein